MYLRTEKVRMLIRYNIKEMMSGIEKGVQWYVHVCLCGN